MRWRDIASGYIEAALWSSGNPDHYTDPEAPEFLDAAGDLAPGQALRMGLEACRWARANLEIVDTAVDALETGEYTGEELVGHNLWLTAQHHGVGFWDRGLGELGDRLTDAAHAHPERDGYVGDDGLIYFGGLE